MPAITGARLFASTSGGMGVAVRSHTVGKTSFGTEHPVANHQTQTHIVSFAVTQMESIS